MVNSQDKGKSFEREIAHLLTGLTEKEWHRVPNSGAFSTKYDVQDSRFKGDLYSEDKEYAEWLIECKITGKPINIAALTSRRSELWAWWQQAKAEAKGKNPVLIFCYRSKGGHSPVFAMSRAGHPVQQLIKDAIGIVDGTGELVLGILEAKEG